MLFVFFLSCWSSPCSHLNLCGWKSLILINFPAWVTQRDPDRSESASFLSVQQNIFPHLSTFKEVNEMPLCRFSLQLSNIQTNITRHSNQISCELLVTHKANSFLCILPGSYYLTYFVLVFRSFRWRAIRFCWPSLKCYKVSGMDVAGLLRLLPSHSLATSLGTNVQLLVM